MKSPVSERIPGFVSFGFARGASALRNPGRLCTSECATFGTAAFAAGIWSRGTAGGGGLAWRKARVKSPVPERGGSKPGVSEPDFGHPEIGGLKAGMDAVSLS